MATDRTIRTLDQMKETTPNLPLVMLSINGGFAPKSDYTGIAVGRPVICFEPLSPVQQSGTTLTT